MHELEPLAAQRLAELMHVVREADKLAAEEEPAAATVGRRPDVREASDGAGVDGRAGLAEEIGCRAGRAVHVWPETRPVELADQVGERLRRTAELAAVVDEEDGERSLPRHRPMLASALARIGIDGLMISANGKGHARPAPRRRAVPTVRALCRGAR